MRTVLLAVVIGTLNAAEATSGVLVRGEKPVSGGRTAFRSERALRPSLGGLFYRQSGRAAGEGALLPADAAVPGWKKTENPRVFTQADLYGYIDGGAELFLEFGFESLTLQKYRNGGSEVAVEIYRMADPTAAAGIYLMKRGKETPDASFKERHTLNRHQLMFQRHRYYVTINNLSGSDKMGPELLRFGSQVAAKLPAPVPASELKALPPAGLVPGSERLFRGPFGLQALYTLGDGDILQLGGRVTGAAADYKTAAGGYTLLLVDYPDAAAAKKAFAHLQQNLDQYLKPSEKTATRLVFKDYESKFGVATLTGRRLEIRLHLVTSPARPVHGPSPISTRMTPRITLYSFSET
jgi:hypothetical protein